MRWRVQLGLFVAAWAIYDIARWVAAGEIGPATENARWVMDLEIAATVGFSVHDLDARTTAILATLSSDERPAPPQRVATG
jgi:hypothetical protein